MRTERIIGIAAVLCLIASTLGFTFGCGGSGGGDDGSGNEPSCELGAMRWDLALALDSTETGTRACSSNSPTAASVCSTLWIYQLPQFTLCDLPNAQCVTASPGDPNMTCNVNDSKDGLGQEQAIWYFFECTEPQRADDPVSPTWISRTKWTFGLAFNKDGSIAEDSYYIYERAGDGTPSAGYDFCTDTGDAKTK